MKKYFILGFLHTHLFVLPLQSMILSTETVTSQLERAVTVVELEVDAKWADPDPVFGYRWTARVTIDHVLEQRPDGRPLPQSGDTVLLRGIGGEGPNTGVIVSGYPRPFVGVRYRAYLVRDGADYSITGFEAGLTALSAQRQFSLNRTDGSDGKGTGAFLTWDPSFFPIPYFISAPSFVGKSNLVPAIVSSFQTWASVEGAAVSFLGLGCSNTSDNQNDGINNVILESNNWPFETGVIAITRNFFISGESPRAGMILDSDIIFNGVNHGFTVTGEAGKFDVQNIMTHEIGHLLGLGHDVDGALNPNNGDAEATMFANANPAETKKRDLAANDIAGIKEGYAGASTVESSFLLTCDISSTPSCLAVHHGGGSARSLIPMLCFLLAVVLLGRLSPYWRAT